MSGGRRFKFEVQAIDAATPVIEKTKAAIGGLNKPVADVDNRLRRLSDSPALGKLSKDIKSIGQSTQDAVGWISELVPSVSTIAGIGAGGGIAAFVNSWAKGAANLGRTAQLIGQSTTELQLWQSAARSAGLTNEDLNSGLDSLAGTLQNAVAGRNQEIRGVMTQLGIGMRVTKDGAVDTTQALNDLADAFDATRAGGRIVVGGVEMSGLEGAKNLARAFGVGNLVPLLMLGRQRIKQLQEEARLSGGIITEADTARAIEYEQALVRVGNAASGTANRIGSILTPAITKSTNAIAAGLTNINGLLEATEKLPAKDTIGSSRFRSAAAAAGGVTTATAPTTSLILKSLGGAGDIASAMGTDLGNWLMGKGPAAGTPFTSANARRSGFGGATPLDQLSSDELLAAARRRPINTPHSGAVRVDVHLRGAPAGTIVNVEQSGDVDARARVETSMPTLGP